MTFKIPLIATLIAITAIGTMIGLGIWQLDRKDQKEELIARYGNASSLQPIAYPVIADLDNLPLYRRSSVHCFEVIHWSSQSGRNHEDASGIAHVAQCKTAGAEGPGAEIAVGWSDSPDEPEWKGGLVEGIISTGRVQPIKLTVQHKIAGLEILSAPSPQAIANNHFLYAIQWFIFAFAATVIYILALRKRMKEMKH